MLVKLKNKKLIFTMKTLILSVLMTLFFSPIVFSETHVHDEHMEQDEHNDHEDDDHKDHKDSS